MCALTLVLPLTNDPRRNVTEVLTITALPKSFVYNVMGRKMSLRSMAQAMFCYLKKQTSVTTIDELYSLVPSHERRKINALTEGP